MSSSYRRLFALFLIIFIDSFGFGLVIPVMAHLLITAQPVFFAHMSHAARNSIFTLTIALSPLASLLSHTIIGAWSDKWGRKITLLICLIGSCLGFLLPFIGIAKHVFALIVIGRFISGFASGSQPIAQAAVTDLCQQRDKTINLSFIAFAMTLAMVLGPMLGGLLSDPTHITWFNNTTPFAFAFILSLVNIGLLGCYFNETHATQKHDHISWRDMINTMRDIAYIGDGRIILGAFFIYEFAWSLYFQSAPLWLIEQYHFNPTQLALFLAAIGFWMSLGLTVILSYLIRLFSSACLFFYALLLASVSVLVACLFPGSLVHWISAIPLAIATGIAYPCMLSQVSDQITQLKQGWIMGVASALLSGSWLASGLLASVLYNLNTHLPLVISFLSYALAAGLLRCVYVRQQTVTLS